MADDKTEQEALQSLIEELLKLHARANQLTVTARTLMVSKHDDAAVAAAVANNSAYAACTMLSHCYRQLFLPPETASQVLKEPHLLAPVMQRLMTAREQNIGAFAMQGVNPLIHSRGLPECISDTIIPKIEAILDEADEYLYRSSELGRDC